MAHWSHKKQSTEAWNYCTKELDADILLFQEAHPTAELADDPNLIFHIIGGSRPWGSGVYSNKYKVREYPFKNSCKGSVVATEVLIEDEFKLIVISVYGLFKKIAGDIYSYPDLHRMLSDLAVILREEATKHRIILGGDLNVSLQIDDKYGGNSNKIFFDRLKELGLNQLL